MRTGAFNATGPTPGSMSTVRMVREQHFTNATPPPAHPTRVNCAYCGLSREVPMTVSGQVFTLSLERFLSNHPCDRRP